MANTLKGKLQAIVDGMGTPAGASQAADIAAIKAVVDLIKGYADTEIASILEDTGTTLPATLTGIEGKIDIIDGLVDAEVIKTAAIKAKTDNLPVSPAATADIANALVDVKHKDINATFDASTDSLEALSDKITVVDGIVDDIKALLGDADLVAGNIKVGVTIANVLGTYTSDATAVAGDIALGKTAYVNGVLVTGTYE